MNSRERTATVLKHQIPDRVPICEVFIDRAMVDRIIGVKGIDSWGLELDDMVKLHEKLGMDAIYYPVFWKPRDQMKNRKVDTGSLVVPEKQFENDLAKCRQLVKKAQDAGLAAIPYTHGCFDVPYEVLGFENYMMLLYDDFDYVDEVTAYFYQFHKRILIEFLKMKPDAILIGDDLAYNSGLMIHPDMFLKLWYNREKDMVQTAKNAGIPVEFHTDGNLKVVLPYLVEMGVDLVNPVDTGANDIFGLKREFGGKIGFRGNVDVAGNLAFGTPEACFLEAKEKILGLMQGGNYVCSSSHSITAAVRPENYLAVVKAVKEYGMY